MENKQIKLRKNRSFGEVISDTFSFCKQELKPLLKSYLLISGVFFIAGAILLGMFMGNLYGPIFTEGFGRRNAVTTNFFENSVSTIIAFYLLMLVVGLVTITIAVTSITVYIKLYKENNQVSPSFEAVWEHTKKYFFPVLGHSFLVMLAIVLGFFVFILPGIYLAIVLAPYAQVIVMEEKRSISEVWGRCFFLIKESFWETFLLYFILSIIVSIVGGGIGLLVGGIVAVVTYFSTHSFTNSISTLYSVSYLFNYAFYIIFWVGLCLQYFSLSEKKEGLGILERIQNMDAQNNSHPNIEERF